MKNPTAIFLCDRTGIAARPWAEAGIPCICVDIEHSIRRDRVEGLITYVWGDVRSWRPPEGIDIVFVGAFPPCTHVAISGAQDFQRKGGTMLRDTLETFESCRMAAAWSGAPYFVENPKGVLGSIRHIGPADHVFNPHEYAGYNADPQQDAYTKETWLWVGNGFVMPLRDPVEPTDGSRMHGMADTGFRETERSASPDGFCRAVFKFNSRQVTA